MSITAKLMLVDDSPGHISLLGGILEADYDILVANNGEQALALAAAELPDLILLDVIMPEMDGYEVCQRLKNDEVTSEIPVIFTTANSNPEEIVKGLEVGASYYLTKPIDSKILKAVVKSVLEDIADSKNLKEEVDANEDGYFDYLDRGFFSIRTTDDAHELAVRLARLCPDPQRSVLGLLELLMNGVEHGNLGITYREKTILNEKDRWKQEVNRRLQLPENLNKKVVVEYEKLDDELRFLIVDEGEGFDWEPYMEIDPSRVFDTHGRGIAMALKVSFDSINYQNKGNEVLAVIKRNSDDKPNESQ
ncbi:MAG: response regulator [Magnetococcales bacterium]|nr:response regulator [Magnetococcales bacterium]